MRRHREPSEPGARFRRLGDPRWFCHALLISRKNYSYPRALRKRKPGRLC